VTTVRIVGGNEILMRVEAPHFVAGLIVTKGRVVRAAPILKWSLGKQWVWIASYIERKGWRWRAWTE
jgi:hypothetical protein